MMLAEIEKAQAAGARLSKICEHLGISSRTVERWRLDPEGDDERRGPKLRPGNALSPLEEARVLATLEKHPGLAPKQLVAKLADENVYVASESTMYRLLRRKRGSTANASTRRHGARAKRVHQATRPESGLELGHHVATDDRARSLLLPVSRPRRLESPHHWLDGRGARDLRARLGHDHAHLPRRTRLP